MNRRLPHLLAVLTAVFLAASLRADLRGDVDAAIRSSSLGQATVAVSIRDVDSGAELVAVNGAAHMIPASNMKLLTTGAALHVLGPEHEFRTMMLRDGPRLIVRGCGDPAFGDPDLLALMDRGDGTGLSVEEFLHIWVRAVQAAGITQITELVADDRIFDRTLVHEAWPADQLNRAYCAEVAGLNFHLNVLHFFPRPSEGTRPAVADYRPRTPGVELINRATGLGGDAGNTLWIARRLESNELHFYGNVRERYRVPVAVTVHDPPLLFARVLADRLERAGVPVGTARTAVAGETLEGTVIGPAVGTPIATVITRCNRDSENLYAEALLKRIGRAVAHQPGSWLNGGAVVRHVLHERLAEPRLTQGLVVSDGSGLSRENRVAASTMTAWLDSLHRDPRLSDVYLASLAVGGESGTLQKRFAGVDLRGASIYGKSGYINFVSCLSGYVTASHGSTRSFSILVNDLREPGSVRRAKDLQEQIVAAIAAELAPTEALVETMGSD